MDEKITSEAFQNTTFTANDDTICALSTAPGVGGIAVVRVTGSTALQTVQKIWKGKNLTTQKSHTAHLGYLTYENDPDKILDQAVATIYRGPHSYTGQDTVELAIHGSIYLQQETVHQLIKAGARLARPGEFTQRAFIAGKIDLIQAEAIADILAATGQAAHDLAVNQLRGGVSQEINKLREELINLASLLELELDFSEEDVTFASRDQILRTCDTIIASIENISNTFETGQAIKNGIPVAIVGNTNVGKSSLLNALLGDSRAIVSDIHGTTRDIIEDTLNIGPYILRLMDTAGLRENTQDQIEKIGMGLTHKAIEKATIILLVTDPTTQSPQNIRVQEKALSQKTTPRQLTITLINKSDLTNHNHQTTSTPESIQPESTLTSSATTEHIHISAKTGEGLETLKQKIHNYLSQTLRSTTTTPVITNIRQRQALREALDHARQTRQTILQDQDTVITAQHLRQTIQSLSTLTGQITTPTLLSTIFSRFCIGK